MRLLRGFPLALLAVGLVARIAPLFDLRGRNLWQFPSEDGYLMLTIARNIALGRGMSIADGTIPTNGTQPLMSYVYAAGFWLVDGDKPWGVLVAQGLQIAIALAATFLLYHVGRRLLAGQPGGDFTAAIAAALWFAAPLTVAHTQNGLETSAYAFAVLAIAAMLLRLPGSGAPWPWGGCVALGAVLGVGFWVRNDASLFVTAICAARVVPVLWRGFAPLWQRGLEAFAVGATALLIAAPWLVHNKLRFGHFRPISGVAEGTGFTPGENLVHIPVALAEYAMIVLPIPAALEERPLVIAVSLLIAAAAIAASAALVRRLDASARQCLALLGLGMAAFIAFYGLSFGVGFFIGRYFFVFSSFLTLVTVYWVRRGLHLAAVRAPALPLAAAAALAVLMMVAGLGLRLYRNGMEHGHIQVVRWVEENVPDTTWVGAIQTGTLGFFHDRTINLDGKVNPRALEARLAGRTQAYVIETPIEYLVDWVGIETWLEIPSLHDRFSLRTIDRERNLVVLARQAEAAGVAD